MGNLTKPYLLRLSFSLWGDLQAAADADGLSIAQFIRMALIEYVRARREYHTSPKGQAVEEAAQDD